MRLIGLNLANSHTMIDCEVEITKMSEILKSEKYEFLKWRETDFSEDIKIKLLEKYESTNQTEVFQQAS